MYDLWTRHLSSEKEKEDFRKIVQGSKPVLKRVKELLDQEEKALDQTELDPKAFDTPNWAYKQAFKNGFRKGLNITQKLVDLDQQETKQ
jgi:hypothetical protein